MWPDVVSDESKQSSVDGQTSKLHGCREACKKELERNLGSIPSSRKNTQKGSLINTELAQIQTNLNIKTAVHRCHPNLKDLEQTWSKLWALNAYICVNNEIDFP